TAIEVALRRLSIDCCKCLSICRALNCIVDHIFFSHVAPFDLHTAVPFVSTNVIKGNRQRIEYGVSSTKCEGADACYGSRSNSVRCSTCISMAYPLASIESCYNESRRISYIRTAAE